MAGLPFKRGLVPVQGGQAASYNGQVRVYRTSVAQASAIFEGDLLVLTATGRVQTASQTTSVPGAKVVGVALGGFWIDPVSKKPVEQRFIPASTSSGKGVYQGINFTADAGPAVKVATDLNIDYAIKFDTSVPITSLGDRADVKGDGGSTISGQTSITATVSGANAGSPLKIVDLFRAEDVAARTSVGGTNVNDWGSPETVVLVNIQSDNSP